MNEDYFKSIKTYEHLLNLIPLDHSVYYNLGRAYIKYGEYDKAIDALENAIKLDSNYVPA